MCRFKKVALFLLSTVASLPYACLANEQVITLSVAESIITHADFSAYCRFEKTLKKMGYQVKQVPHPFIRTISETQNGHMAMVLVGKVKIDKISTAKETEQGITINSSPDSTKGIEITTTPYSIMDIEIYTKKHRNILISKTNWQADYLIGLARSPHSHDIKKYDANYDENHHYYINTLSAFKALIKGRVDLVVASELAYFSARLALNLDNKVKSIATLGTASLYPGFSSLYFGEHKAKIMAQQYDSHRAQLSLSELQHCDKSSPYLIN